MNDKQLNVLHISTADNSGGSARSAYRIHTGLKELGVKSNMLVGRRITRDQDIDYVAGKIMGRVLDKITGKITDFLGLQYLFFFSSLRFIKHPWFRQANILQLYNTHGNYFNHLILPKICKKIPVIWRLSDMWPMTAHCAYAYDCEKWKNRCESCPALDEYPPLCKDTTALLFKLKDKMYKRSKLTIVAPSRWIASCVKESPLLKSFPIHIIPNGLDTKIFRPILKDAAREVLGIDRNKLVILFSALEIKYERKGGVFLQKALEILSQDDLENVELLILGENSGESRNIFKFPTKYINRTDNDLMLAMVYSAADLFVLPSLADNLPNGLIESMACGTPCISFDVGGIPDAVRHKQTGYLAKYKDIEDLAAGIKLLIRNEGLRSKMSLSCRRIVENEYTKELQAKRFLDLYNEVLKK